jgi:hypothetical protein
VALAVMLRAAWVRQRTEADGGAPEADEA